MTAESSASILGFEAQRPLLLGVAYRMLGSMADAEDVVQEAYLRYAAVPSAEVRDERALLVTIVTRISLDVLKSAKRRREEYVGPWLPEPVRTAWSDDEHSPEGVVERRESISLAFLLLLERLSPLERAAFLLHDVFDYGHEEAATMLDRSPVAARQLVHRARRHLAGSRTRFPARPEDQQRLVQGFLDAVMAGETARLVGLLSDDVAATSDGGGRAVSARRTVYGADRVARFLVGLTRKEPPHSVSIEEINGCPAVVARRHRRPYMVVSPEVVEGRIVRVFLVRNPEKLEWLPEPIAVS